MERSWQRVWCTVSNTEYSTVAQWARDLHEEGIEPHPGPGPIFVNMNVRGLSAPRKFNNFIFAVRNHAKKHRDAHVYFMIQSHNIRGDERMQKYKKIADRYGYLMAGGHIPENAPVGEVGGTAILIPHRAIPRGKNEGKDVAITKVRRRPHKRRAE